LAIPALVVALPVELAGGLLGRGAVITLRFRTALALSLR